ncbi:MAG: hypothetical protein AAB874_00865 [Patescibacteria group bacterium]
MEGVTSTFSHLEQDPRKFFGFYSEGTKIVASNIFGQTCFLLIEATGSDRDRIIEVVQQSAELGYSILSKKRFYNEAHGKLLERLFNVVSRQVFKISNGESFGSLTIFDISKRSWWAGRIGEGRCYLYREKQIVRLVPDNDGVSSTPLLGEMKEPLPQLTRGDMRDGDIFVVTEKSLMSVVNENRLQQILTTSMESEEPEKTAVNHMLVEASERRKRDTYAAWVIRP